MTREEALNEIKSWDFLEGKEIEAIETLIPELAESEDERIRKKMIEHFKSKTKDTWCNMPVKSILAWLEKQKEQKCPEFCNGHCADCELKEQKPAEWNDTDMKEARANLISVCMDWERGKQTTLLPIVAVRARYFLEHLTEPKPAEWSEEDEEKLKAICTYLRGYSRLAKLSDKLRFNEYCDFLKSLRPSWKPTEHQMTILKAVKEYVGKGSGYWGEGLGSLIDDLEKL